MSVDTKAKFLGKLDAEALLSFVKENIDPNAESTIETEEREIYSKFHDGIIFFGEKEGVEKLTSGFIHFAHNGEIRSLHYYHHDTVWLDKNSFERNIKQGTPELNNEVTELSLGFNETAVEVMKKIAEFFGGYVREDDFSHKWYYKVEKG
jgi:hypothetical protein